MERWRHGIHTLILCYDQKIKQKILKMIVLDILPDFTFHAKYIYILKYLTNVIILVFKSGSFFLHIFKFQIALSSDNLYHTLIHRDT